MPRSTSKHPTELELQILKILWDSGPLAVRDVRTGLIEHEGRELAHTSVVTTLNTMERKKYLRKSQAGNAYIFEAAVKRKDVSQGMVKDVVDRVFDGSVASLMLSLIDNAEISSDEHQALRDIINKSKKSKRGKSK